MSQRKSRKRATVDDLAASWGISSPAVEKYLKHPDAPRRGQDGKWSLVDALEYRKRRMEERRGNKPPAPDTVEGARYRKLDLECQRLALELDKARGEVVSIAEVTTTLAEYAGLVNDCFHQFELRVAAMTHDAGLVDAAEKLTHDMRNFLADAVKASAST